MLEVPVAEMAARGLVLDDPNKVFREVKTLDGWFIEPSNSAVALIFAENIHDGAGVRALKEKLFIEEVGKYNKSKK